MTVTKELVQTLIESNPGGCIAYLYKDDRMEALGFSGAVSAVSGYPAEELKAMLEDNPYHPIYEEDVSVLKELVNQCLKKGEDLDCTYRVVCKNGRILWVICRGKIIGEMEGCPVLFATIQNAASADNQIDLVNNVPSGMGIFKLSDRVSEVFLNDGYYEMLGMKRSERVRYMGDNYLEAVHPEDQKKFISCIEQSRIQRQPFRETIRLKGRNETEYFWVQIDGKIVETTKNATTFYVSFTNIDKLQQLNHDVNELLAKLKTESEHDPLTGIYNRRKAYEESTKLIAEHPEETFAIVHFDIQRFRLYNSFFGEEEGDRLLIYIADMFRELYKTHKYGVYGRIEADVFFLCFPFAEEVIQWNEEYIHNKLLTYRKDFMITGSCGVYVVKHQMLSVEAMFNRASEAAQNCKNKQLTRVSFYNDKMEEQLQKEHRIAGEMRGALEYGEFKVYIQPKFAVKTGKPCGGEALVRWISCEHGMIAPDNFIPLFEKNGFIISLDQYMWESVCRLLRKWLDQGKKPGPVSVNVSRVSMYSPETVPFLKNLIEIYRIPPELLNLELTESAYMDDPEEMIKRLQKLRELGFKIMIDDFGSGYSSLNTLRELPFDFLKIDRKFLASIEVDNRSRIVLAAVIKMANALKTPVIVEGVETEQQRDFLSSLGCKFIQGFLYSRPLPIEEYENLTL